MANIIKQLQDANGNNIYPIAYAQGGVKMDLLWTNPNPSSEYSAKTETLDLTDYDFVFITFKWGASSARAMLNCFVMVDGGGVITSSVYNARVYREITCTTSGVTFGAGAYANTISANMTSPSNSTCVPQQIFGIKFSWIVPTTVQGLQYIEV